jgi:hypothetical protein
MTDPSEFVNHYPYQLVGIPDGLTDYKTVDADGTLKFTDTFNNPYNKEKVCPKTGKIPCMCKENASQRKFYCAIGIGAVIILASYYGYRNGYFPTR